MTEKIYLSTLLNNLETRKNELDLSCDAPNYELVQNYCSEFFNGLEKLENKAIIKYLLDFDFTKIFDNGNGTTITNEKETEFFICLLALTIDKFGVDQLIKDMLPEHVKEEKLSLFRKILSFFHSLFYKKDYIEIDFSSPIYKELNEAVWDIRYTTKESTNYSNRGDLFFGALCSLGYAISHNFSAPEVKIETTEKPSAEAEKVYKTIDLPEFKIESTENMPTTAPSTDIAPTIRREKFMDGVKERCRLMMEKEKEQQAKENVKKGDHKTPVENSLMKIEEEKETKNNQTKKRSGLFYGRLFQTVRDNFTKSDREQLIRDMKKIVKVG
jgi:hypothetical protein